MWFLVVLVLGMVALGLWMWKRPDPVTRDQAKAAQNDLWIENLTAQLNHANRLCSDVQQPNFERAYQIYEDLAKQQDLPQAYVGMGLMHLKGQGRPQSTEHAINLLENAFRLGSDEAAYALGQVYDTNAYNIANPEKALYWYRHAVARGNLDAQYRITELNEQDQVGAHQQKLQLLIQNAEQGHSASQYQLAQYYLAEGRAQDLGLGIHYLFMATQQDHLGANQEIASRYAKGDILPRDLSQSLIYIKHCVSLGDQSGVFDYYQGVLLGDIDVDQRQRVIQHLQHLSYEEKSPQAKNLLALAHFHGWFVDKNETMAYRYWSEAAQYNAVPSLCALAALHFESHISDANSEQAFELFSKATELEAEEFFSQMGLALCYLHGVGTAKDGEKATQMIRAMAKLKLDLEVITEADLIYCVGYYYSLPEYPLPTRDKAIQYLNQAVSKGSKEAAWLLYQAFSGKLPVFTPDEEQAKRYIHQAAQMGHVEAQALLGTMYLKGIQVEADTQLGLEYLNKASVAQNGVALNALAEAMEQGIGTEANLQQAVHLYQKAATQVNPDAYAHLGRLYTKGIGVDRDIKLARQWLEKGSQIGHAASIEQLKNLNAYLEMSNQL